jgi:hypothetical protein
VARLQQTIRLEARKTAQPRHAAAHVDHSLRLAARSESISKSEVVFTSRNSAGVSSKAQVLRPTLRRLAPGSPSHCARKEVGSDVRRTRSASRHKCELSSSSRVSSILTEPSVRLQTGHVDSYVPLSFCLRRNLRGCGAAKEWPLCSVRTSTTLIQE